MKLHWSPKSPYVRKVDAAALEAGLDEQITRVRSVVSSATVNEQVIKDNPLGKIPTMTLADGRVLFDSLVICLHFDELRPGILLPGGGPERLAILTHHALAQGLTDLFILWRQELERPEPARSQPLLAAFEVKACGALDRLEHSPPALAPNLAAIATGCALGYADFRFPQLDWRHGRPRLAGWEQEFAARPSMRSTLPHG